MVKMEEHEKTEQEKTEESVEDKPAEIKEEPKPEK